MSWSGLITPLMHAQYLLLSAVRESTTSDREILSYQSVSQNFVLISACKLGLQVFQW